MLDVGIPLGSSSENLVVAQEHCQYPGLPVRERRENKTGRTERGGDSLLEEALKELRDLFTRLVLDCRDLCEVALYANARAFGTTSRSTLRSGFDGLCFRAADGAVVRHRIGVLSCYRGHLGRFPVASGLEL